VWGGGSQSQQEKAAAGGVSFVGGGRRPAFPSCPPPAAPSPSLAPPHSVASLSPGDRRGRVRDAQPAPAERVAQARAAAQHVRRGRVDARGRDSGAQLQHEGDRRAGATGRRRACREAGLCRYNGGGGTEQPRALVLPPHPLPASPGPAPNHPLTISAAAPHRPHSHHPQGPYRAYQLQTADLTCSSLGELTVYNIRRLFVSGGGGPTPTLPPLACGCVGSLWRGALPVLPTDCPVYSRTPCPPSPRLQANRGQEMMDVEKAADPEQWDSDKRRRSRRRLGIALEHP
jgi:hypothetical protein